MPFSCQSLSLATAQTWQPANSPALNRITFEHRTKCRITMYTNPVPWDSFVEGNHQIIDIHWPIDANFSPLLRHLMCQFRSMFSSTKVSQDTSFAAGLARIKWQLFQELRMLSRHDFALTRIFHGWRLATQRAMLQRTQAVLAKDVRRNRFEALIAEARDAANHQNNVCTSPNCSQTHPQAETCSGPLPQSQRSPSLPVAGVRQHQTVCQQLMEGSPLDLLTGPGVPFTESELVTALRSLKAPAPTLVFLAMHRLWHTNLVEHQSSFHSSGVER